ncbi:hypothetical protein WME90_32875 [Sorangium sp. So ce375]|uniref:hypothetical protein n=1 Tax=Sorangium sp. So ce375 TaxID=3133306 RepID=UPI003F5B0802
MHCSTSRADPASVGLPPQLTGRMRAFAAEAVRNAPRRNGRSLPVVLRVPFGKNTVDQRGITLRRAAPSSSRALRALSRSTGVWP